MTLLGALLPPPNERWLAGWYRHVSKREGALFLHNPTTGESVWFKGWVKRKSKMYARDYWFKPTTGRAEWELPVEASSLEPKVLPKGEDVVSSREKPSNDKVKGWMAKIRAAKAAAEAKRVSGEADGVLGKVRKRQDDGSSGDDMDVDNDTDGGDDLPVSSASVVGAPPLPSLPHQRAPGVPQAPPASPMHLGSAREDSPYVAVRRETLRKECLRRFADENSRLGAMRGYSKTSRSCREEGMAVGLSGMYGRCGRRTPYARSTKSLLCRRHRIASCALCARPVIRRSRAMHNARVLRRAIFNIQYSSRRRFGLFVEIMTLVQWRESATAPMEFGCSRWVSRTNRT